MKKLLMYMTAITLFSACRHITPAGQITIDSFNILYHHNVAVQVAASGNILLQNEKVAAITGNGKVTNTSGRIIATYSNDTLHCSNDSTQVRIDAEGTIYYQNSTYSWDKDGQLLVNNIVTDYSLEPHDARNHLCASIIYFLTFECQSVIPFSAAGARTK